MSNVFISYAREDATKADAIRIALEDQGLSVFVDRTIRAGALWTPVTLDQLESARVVIVLWSEASVGSIWVLGEAAKAAQRRVLLPVQLDDSSLPFPFERFQSASLADWDGTRDHPALKQLLARVTEEAGTSVAFGNVEPVEPGQEVSHRHLHMIDTTWRDMEREAERNDGRWWYQLRVIVFGHRSALDRVERVIYHLPDYPPESARQEKGRHTRPDCFQLKELANGYSVLQAEAHIQDQPEGSPRVLRLERFIILGETGPRLDPFIQQARSAA